MPLTDPAIRSAKPEKKQYKISDEKGLYVLVKPAGNYFRFDYRFLGKRKTLALGVYPDVSLKDAREAFEDARRLLKNGVDPIKHRKETKALKKDQAGNSFKV